MRAVSSSWFPIVQCTSAGLNYTPVIISDLTRTGHSLQQTSRVESQNIWSGGETAVSQEQIGTDRINVNENFMIRHHAILMSRSMSALPGLATNEAGDDEDVTPRYWHTGTHALWSEYITIILPGPDTDQCSGGPNIVLLSLNPILSESHDCQVQAPNQSNISAHTLLFQMTLLTHWLSIALFSVSSRCLTNCNWAQHILMMMICNCVWWWDYNIIMMSIQISWPWPWSRSSHPQASPLTIWPLIGWGRSRDTNARLWLVNNLESGAGKLITPCGGIGPAR